MNHKNTPLLSCLMLWLSASCTLAQSEQNVPAKDLATLERLLSKSERQRAGRFRFARDRERFIVARATLRILLGKYLDKPPSAVALTNVAHCCAEAQSE